MNISSEHQALMLSALYGELTAPEKQEWETILAGSPALRLEFERLQTTIGIINQAENSLENPSETTSGKDDEAFYEAQWEALRNLQREEKKPVFITLPESKSKFIPFSVPRRYLAAATVLILLGFGASIYRWQMKNGVLTNEMASEQAREGVLKEQPTPFGASTESPGDSALEKSEEKKQPANSSDHYLQLSGSTKKNNEKPLNPAAQEPSTSREQQRSFDDIAPLKDSYKAPSGSVSPVQIAPTQLPSAEVSDRENVKPISEEKAESSVERKENLRQPSKQDMMRLQSTPNQVQPSTPALNLMQEAQPQKRVLPSGILPKTAQPSTKATMRVDSVLWQDTLHRRK